MLFLFRRAFVATLLTTAVVLPPMAMSAGAATVPRHSTQPQAVLTATGCNGNTCQVVSGSGTEVTSWYTQATAPSAVCTYARFLENGTIIAESGNTCLKTGQSASATWNDPGSFSTGTVLCTSWAGISGRPCDRIE